MIDATEHSAVAVCDVCGGCRGIYATRAEARTALAAHEEHAHPGVHSARSTLRAATRRAGGQQDGNVLGR